MDCFYWTTIIGLTVIIGGLTAWRFRELDQKIEELRNELRETQREQGERKKHLPELLKMDADSRYEAIVQIMTKEQSVRKKNDEATKHATDGLFDIVDKLIWYTFKLENDHSATVAAQQAKIDCLEQENREDIRELKADSEQREALGNMEEQVQREYQAETAALEKNVYQIVNETLHSITELFIFEMKQARESKNDTAALAEEIQQIKSHIVQIEETVRNLYNLSARYAAKYGKPIGGCAQDMVPGIWTKAPSFRLVNLSDPTLEKMRY